MKICRMEKIKLAVLAIMAGWLLMTYGHAVRIAAQTAGQGREFHETYDLAPNGSVSVINDNGNIRVTSWNENRVKVDAIKRVRGGRIEDLNLVEIQVTARPERIEIRTIYPRRISNNISVDFELKVPRAAELNSLNSVNGNIIVIGPVAQVTARSTNGEVSAQEVTGVTSLASTNGAIRAERIGGELRAVTTNGEVIINDVASRLYAQSTNGSVSAVQIRDDATVTSTNGNARVDRAGGRAIARSTSGGVSVNDVGGDVQAESTNDNVTVTNVRGRVTATGVSGNITVRKVEEGVRVTTVSGRVEISDSKGRIEVNSNNEAIVLNNIDSNSIRATSFNDNVRFAGKVYDKGYYEFRSNNGNIVLLLPPDSNFRLTARTNGGSINTEFPVQLGSMPSQRTLVGTVGKGGAEVIATSFNGNIFIRKNAK